MKKRARLINALIIILVLSGIGVLCYPTVCDMYYKRQASREISQYNRVMDAGKLDYSELWAAAEEYNSKLAEEGNFSVSVTEEQAEYISGFLNPLGTGMMGYISIPSIDVSLPVYQGTEESVLQSGAGYWIGTSLPTGGSSTHCVITAHSGLVKAKLFTDLDKLKEGDTFTLSILDRVLTYEVDSILVTEPDDFAPMEIVEGEDLVTLYACYPYGVNTHRILVRGHRILTADGNISSDGYAAEDGGYGLVKIVIIVCVCYTAVLLIAFALYEKFRYKGKYEKTRKMRREERCKKRLKK